MSKICFICHKKIGVFDASENYKGSYEPICESCYNKYWLLEHEDQWDDYENEDISERIDILYNNLKEDNEDDPSRKKFRNEIKEKIESVIDGYENFSDKQNAIGKYFQSKDTADYDGILRVSTLNKVFAILKGGKYASCYKFDELLDYSVVEDGNSVISGRSGSSAIGAFLIGTPGAIIGSAGSRNSTKMISQLDIVISIKGPKVKTEEIKLLNYAVSKDSSVYTESVRICNQIVAALKQILDITKNADEKPIKARAIYAFSVADEIRKFKELQNEGIITAEEFQLQKEKLLHLDY